jgi:hypothetical protein
MIYSKAEFGTKIASLNMSLALCPPFQTYRWREHKTLMWMASMQNLKAAWIVITAYTEATIPPGRAC